MTGPTTEEAVAIAHLYAAAKYLRDSYGRSATATARRIITVAAKMVGTEGKVDLTNRYIQRT